MGAVKPCVICGADGVPGKPTCPEHTPESPYFDDFKLSDVKAPHPQPCAWCPFRVSNQLSPPTEHEGSEAFFYTARTREALWEGYGQNGEGLARGHAMTCHCASVEGRVHECTGSVALKQRAVLRWCRTQDRGPLLGLGPTWIIADMLGVDWHLIKRNPWTLNGEAITYQRLVRVAHPSVFDAEYASEQMPAPTADELEEWGRIRDENLAPVSV